MNRVITCDYGRSHKASQDLLNKNLPLLVMATRNSSPAVFHDALRTELRPPNSLRGGLLFAPIRTGLCVSISSRITPIISALILFSEFLKLTTNPVASEHCGLRRADQRVGSWMSVEHERLIDLCNELRLGGVAAQYPALAQNAAEKSLR